MKRLLLGASLVTLVTGVAAANPSPAVATDKPVVPNVHVLTYKVAPADEYFGKLKLSILGIGNTIKDQGAKIDADPTQVTSVLNSCSFTEDAIHDWESKYPKDSWIPHTVFTLERLYAKIDNDLARAKAKATMLWLVHDYPASGQARIGKAELAANKVGVKPVAMATSSPPAIVDAPPPSPAPSPK